MNNFFKMSLVAAAVAVSSTATAGVFTQATNIYSAEGLAITTAAEQMAADVEYTFDADYEAAAKIKFTFSAGSMGASSVFEDSVIVNATTGAVTFTKSAQDANSVTYTLTAKTSDATTLLGSKFVIKGATDLGTVNGLTYNTAAIKAGSVTVTANSEYSGVVFDKDTTTSAAADAKKNVRAYATTQFGTFATSNVADGVISLTATNALDKVLDNADSIVIGYTAPTVVPTLAVVGKNDSKGNDLSTVKLTTAYEVVGNYPGFKKTQIVDDTATTEVSSVTAKGLKVTLEAAADVADADLLITPAATNDALVVQKFTVIPTITYGTTVVTGATLPAGEWTVSAETVNIPYMPYGTGISQIIYATNTSNVAANVSAVATDENGNSYALGVIGVAKAGGAVTKFTQSIKDALIAQGFTSGKLSIDLVFAGVTAVDSSKVVGLDAAGVEVATLDLAKSLKLPEGAIKVNSAYNVNGSDRGFVSNTTNGSN